MALKVYYGFTKLTKKIVRKRELAIYFENEYSYKNENWINRRIHLVCTRFQTKKEMKDSQGKTRMFTKYSYYIDSNKYKGDIKQVLNDNFQADSKNISAKEGIRIQSELYKQYKLLNY